MADSVCVQIAEAIKDALVTEIASATSTLSMQFEPQRLWLPRFDRAKAGELQVTCIARGDTSELQTRSDTRHTYTVVIDVRQAIDPQQPETLDRLTKLVEEICDYLRKRKMASSDWVSANADLIYDATELYQSHMFVAQIEAVYTKQRAIT